MSVFCNVFVAMLASLGVALTLLELFRHSRAKRSEFICLCFREDLLESGTPDMVIICRNDAEIEEIIKRIGEIDNRRIYLKYI